jgi:hypothetical protein
VATPFDPSPLAARVAADAEVRDRDLGFGSVISRDSKQRLLNRDGSFNVVREGLGVLETIAPYQSLLTISWLWLIALITALYLAINVVFAVLFLACGPGALAGPGAQMLGGRFSQAFFFSIQTFATIGYGQIAPNGLAANVTVTVEALVGLMYQALATGLLFARFTRPTASVLFSRRAVVAPYGDGGQGLMFRIVLSSVVDDRASDRRRQPARRPHGRGARTRAGGDPRAAVGHRRSARADGPLPVVVSRRRDHLERAIPVDVPARGRRGPRDGGHQPRARDRSRVADQD